MTDDLTLHLVLPRGTHIVTRVPVRAGGVEHPAGAVGVVVTEPADATHAYLIRFPDGSETALRRTEISVRKQVRRDALEARDDVAAEWNLQDRVILKCVIGSRAYGLDHADSDTDRRGIYLPPAELDWSLFGSPEQLESHEKQECYWEIRKFLILALKANPSVLECLYTPLVEHASPLAQELLAMKSVFLSRLIYQTYNGYVMSQFKKMEQDLRTKGEIRWKHAMHLLRLLLSGITALSEGFVPVRLEENRDRLLAVRRGEVPWAEADAWRLELHRQFDAAFADTKLPERPDFARANEFLIRARRSAAGE